MEERLRSELVKSNDAIIQKQVDEVSAHMHSQFKEKLKEVKAKHKSHLELQLQKQQDRHNKSLAKQGQALRLQMQEEFAASFKEYEGQVLEEHVQELDQLREQVLALQTQLEQAVEIAEKNMEHKYEMRLELVRKMHNDELHAHQQASELRQRQLEDQALEFIRERK